MKASCAPASSCAFEICLEKFRMHLLRFYSGADVNEQLGQLDRSLATSLPSAAAATALASAATLAGSGSPHSTYTFTGAVRARSPTPLLLGHGEEASAESTVLLKVASAKSTVLLLLGRCPVPHAHPWLVGPLCTVP